MKFQIDFQSPFLAKLINESRNQKPAQWNGNARELSEWEGREIECVRDHYGIRH